MQVHGQLLHSRPLHWTIETCPFPRDIPVGSGSKAQSIFLPFCAFLNCGIAMFPFLLVQHLHFVSGKTELSWVVNVTPMELVKTTIPGLCSPLGDCKLGLKKSLNEASIIKSLHFTYIYFYLMIKDWILFFSLLSSSFPLLWDYSQFLPFLVCVCVYLWLEYMV